MSDREFTRRVVKAVAIIAGAVVLLAALWEARGALMLIYVSALIAMGFSPLVRIIERPHRDRRFVPRWLAILAIYLSIVGVIALIGLLVVPPLMAQASSLWERAPTEFNRLQTWLIEHHLLTRRVTLEQAVENAPSAHRRRVRAHYDSHSQLLFPDRSRGDGRLLRSLRAGGAARRRGDRGARSGG